MVIGETRRLRCLTYQEDTSCQKVEWRKRSGLETDPDPIGSSQKLLSGRTVALCNKDTALQRYSESEFHTVEGHSLRVQEKEKNNCTQIKKK